MFGWRARIGLVNPTAQAITQERNQLLPEGVALIYSTLDRAAISSSEIERILPNYLVAAQRCADLGADLTILSGSAVLEYNYGEARRMVGEISRATGVPTILTTETNVKALRAVGAKRILIISPFVRELDENRAKIFQAEGFEVVGIKGLGLKHTREFIDLPAYAPYRLALQAAREFPDCDTINVHCPSWHVTQNIEPIEQATGKTVVAAWAAELYTALTELHIGTPINGHGRLLGLIGKTERE